LTALISDRLVAPSSIELRAALRYTGTRLPAGGTRAFRAAMPSRRAVLEFISNISKA
jgi:hypothetical protein